MTKGNPISEGFRAVMRNPSLLLAEVAWRWVFGAAAIALIAIGVREVQLAVTVAPGDELMIRSLQPVLMAQAWSHILRDTLPLLAKLAAVLLPALTLMWIVAATVGRTVTTRGLVEYFGNEYETLRSGSKMSWGAMGALHCFRAAVLLAVVLGYIGAALVASRFATATAEGVPQIDAALTVFVLIFAVVVVVAAAINWVLALAPVFVARDGAGTWESLAQSVKMFRTRGSRFTAVATMNGFMRTAVVVAVSVAGLFPVMLVGQVPGALVWALLIGLTLVYCVVSDWLLLARLGAYVAVVEQVRMESETPQDQNLDSSQNQA